MRFENFSVGEHVHFSPKVAAKASHFADADSWQGEPLDCLMEVERATSENIALSCCTSCGAHVKMEFSVEEYNEYSSILGEGLFRRGSVSAYLAERMSEEDAKSAEEYEPEEYNLQQEWLSLANLISKQVKQGF
jgi:hypothetical protein